MYSQLMVLSEPVKDREDEYNDWYTWVHIRDVMRLSRVVVAVQRFRRAAKQLVAGGSARYPQTYMALYENTDPVRMTADHAPMLSDDMPISSAYSYDTPTTCAYYDSLLERNVYPGMRPKADLIVQWIGPAACSSEIVDWYTRERFPALVKLPGVISGSVGKACDHQMPGPGHRPELTCIYRTTSLDDALRAWAEIEAVSPAPWNAEDASVCCFSPIIDRLTLNEVMEPDDISRETARRKRESMGDRRHRAVPAAASR